MDQKQFSFVAGAIFALVALVHLWRIFAGWPVVIDGWTVPMWLSWFGIIVGVGLSFSGLRLATRK